MRSSTSYDAISNQFLSFDRAVTAPLSTSKSISSFRPYTSYQNNRVFKRNTIKPLNPFPIIHSPRRAIELELTTTIPSLEIKKKQSNIGNILSSINREQRLKTAELLSSRKNPEPVIEKNDSFFERYEPKKNKFTHKLLGDIKLPRKYFHLTSNDQDLKIININQKSQTLQNVSYEVKIPKLEGIKKDEKARILDMKKRAFTSIRHFNQMKLNAYAVSKLNELMPKEPYSQPKSKEFIMACKLGEIDDIQRLLHANRWLAHAFDTARQTGLHWAARRNFTKIIDLLISYGTYIDAKDMAGRTPLFLAVKNGNSEAVSVFISKKSNPFIKTRAGNSIDSVASNFPIRHLVFKTKAKVYVKKFVINPEEMDFENAETVVDNRKSLVQFSFINKQDS